MPRVLVVDDNALNRELMVALLEPRGYEVAVASDAAEGLRLAEGNRPDVILMDIGLPVLDGLEATRRLRSTPSLADLKVIAVSAHAMETDRRRALDAGCDGFVTKPIQLDILLAEMQRHLG